MEIDVYQFHDNPFETANDAVEGLIGLAAHAGSFYARFTGSQFEVEQPFELRFYGRYHMDAFQQELERVIEEDSDRFPLGAIITEGDVGYLTSLVIRTKTGNEYTVHVVTYLKP